MNMVRNVTRAAVVVACSAWASGAYAQSDTSSTAEELFKQGRAALDAKDYPTACQKLAESNRLERAVGTLISLAQCEEAQSHLAAARSHWQEAADLADALRDRLQRGAVAREKVAALDKRVARLTIRIAPNAPADTIVTSEGVTLQAAALGAPLPVDPGAHVVVATAAGYEPRKYELLLAEGDRLETVVEPGAALPVFTEAPAAPVEEPRAVVEESKALRIGAYVSGGIGLVGIGVGAAFGLSASSKWSDAKDACKSTANCADRAGAIASKDSATSAGNVSTVAFLVGGAAVATSVVLFVISRPKSGTAIRVTPSVGGLSASGSF